ncbi:hypothetical protein BRADI_4g19983v3 [Brachypodium distachyon]|uniref:Uncharacterized protein n=1 Tax=Brachypodium distachyon TaxID=15368 RepID=A0A2K2CNT2_BRADI|nr:hypothetical protein BRADI_4g19983v3 [Brachypodium distachyon]
MRIFGLARKDLGVARRCRTTPATTPNPPFHQQTGDEQSLVADPHADGVDTKDQAKPPTLARLDHNDDAEHRSEPRLGHKLIHPEQTGRRYIGCSNNIQDCRFVHWVDPEWPNPMKKRLLHLRSNYELGQNRQREMEKAGILDAERRKAMEEKMKAEQMFFKATEEKNKDEFALMKAEEEKRRQRRSR